MKLITFTNDQLIMAALAKIIRRLGDSDPVIFEIRDELERRTGTMPHQLKEEE